MCQTVYEGGEALARLCDSMKAHGETSVFLVHDGAYAHLSLAKTLPTLLRAQGMRLTFFSDFSPNPQYEAVVQGVEAFKKAGCDAILAVGGGSALDVAKCVKLFARMEPSQSYLSQPFADNDIPLAAIPTTAGTGSEATRFAVIYADGEKQSIAHDSILPSLVALIPSVLDTLPVYQRRATMMDTYCHAIESFWSIHADEKSQGYAVQALTLAERWRKDYLRNTPEGNAGMLKAANLSGKAINLTQTTAGHAMSYKLTSLFGIAHGHAVALCVPPLWQYIIEHMEDCIDPRGEAYLSATMNRLGTLFSQDTPGDAPKAFAALVSDLDLKAPALSPAAQLETLVRSVNPVRLKNNPVRLSDAAIRDLYRTIFSVSEEN